MNEKLVVDLEANGFQADVTKLWCISMFNIETKEKETFTDCNDINKNDNVIAIIFFIIFP